MEKESLGPESLAEKFKNGNGLEQYYGKWLLLSGMSPDAEDNLAKTREIPLIRAISGCGNVDTKEIFNSWYKGGRAGTKINQQLLSEEGLAVGEALVFKASSTQSFGNKAKYLAFGTRPTKSVEEMYPKIWSESSSSASSPSGDTSTTSAAANSSSSSSSSRRRKVQKVDSALSSSAEVTSPHGATRPMRTPRPSLPRDYFVYNANDDDETVEAAMEECVQGDSKKRRRTRATTPAESGEAREEGPRDRKSGRFSSSKEHISELESQIAEQLRLLKATAVKMDEARSELALSDKHLAHREAQIQHMETKHVKDLDKVRASEQSKAHANCAKLKRLHESVSKQLLTKELALAKQKDLTAAAEAEAKDAKLDMKQAKTQVGQALRREAKMQALLGKAEGMVSDGKEQAEKLRKERNKAWAERQGLQKSVAKYQKAVASRDKKVAFLEEQRGAAEAEAAGLALEIEDVQEGLDEAVHLLMQARGKMDESEKRELDLLMAGVNEEEGLVETGASVSLIDALGKKKGERWSQDIIELGMELMEKNLSGPQAESVTRAFVHFQHPHLTENVDYRIPSAARFKEWRSFLGPVCHFLAVSIISLAVRVHLIHDATTKDGISVFQTAARVEMPDGSIANFPVKFDLLPSGEAKVEAALIQKALQSHLGSGVYASLVTTVSATSDNAARATTRELRELKRGELESLQALSAAALKDAPKELRHAAEAWAAMSEEQREVAMSMQGLAELGCTGHSVNLTIEDSHKKTEKDTLEANVVRDLAVNVLQRFYGGRVRPNMKKRKTKKQAHHTRFHVPLPLPPLKIRNYYKRSAMLKSTDGSLLDLKFSAGEQSGWERQGGVMKWTASSKRVLRMLPAGKGAMGKDLPDVSSTLVTLSKAFSSFGDDATYYLNESKHLQRWCEVNDKGLVNLPSRKGSRQGWTLAVGTAVMINADAYAEYMHQVRADDKELNKLISTSWNAVSDKYFVAAVSARSFVDVAFAKPLNFFVHADFTARPHLSRIMRCAESWITSLGTLDDVGEAKAPLIDSLATLILSEFKDEDYHEDWKDEYDDWYGKVGEGLEEAHRMATGKDRWHRVSSHLLAACEPMLETHRRNLDEDTSMNGDLAHAPKVSDEVEAGFGCFDYALNKTGASVESAAGVGQSMKMGALKNDAELRVAAHKKALVKQKKWQERRTRKRKRKDDDDDFNGEDEDEGEFDLEAAEEAALKEMKVTSWRNAIPREERWLVIKDLQRHVREHGKERRELRRLVADKALARKKAGVAKSTNRRVAATTNWIRFSNTVVITSQSELDDLQKERGDSHSNYADSLRDQIRVRIHVYGMTDTPALGGGSGDDELTRLEGMVGALVKKPLPSRLDQPSPDFRPFDASSATEGARKNYMQSVKDIVEAWRLLIELTEKGIFRLPVEDEKEEDGGSGGGGGSSSSSKSRRRRGPRKVKPRRTKANERALIGELFEEDGTDWKVLDVEWSDEVKQVVVYYYDVDLANAEGILESDLMESLLESSGHADIEHIEYSSVKEVMGWLKATKEA